MYGTTAPPQFWGEYVRKEMANMGYHASVLDPSI